MRYRSSGVTGTTVRSMALVGVVGAVAAALVGCSSSSDEPSEVVDTAVLGASNKATGTPITIGVISEGKSAAIDATDEIKGIRAAADYANEYLGGIAGHPIALKVCEAQANPAKTTDCANQMVQANVSAVVEGLLGGADQTVAVLSQAKIPLFMLGGSTPATLTTPGVFSMGNAMAYFGSAAVEAKKKGIQRAALVVIGVPGAEGPARQMGGLVFGQSGIELEVVPIPPGVADMTPQISAADTKKPGLYYAFGDETFCTSALKAIKTVNPKAALMIIDRCIAPGSARSIPGGYAGTTVVTGTDLTEDAPDGRLFAAVLDKYGDGAKYGATAASGYAPMLGLVRALNAAAITETTPAAVLVGLQSAPPVDHPLSAGAKMQCNGKQIPIAPAVCNPDGLIAEATEDGTLTNFQRIPYDPALYLPSR